MEPKVPTIHLSSENGSPHTGQKRQHGKFNIGLYCQKCAEFFALIVKDREIPINFTADEPQPFVCPFCKHEQRRSVWEFQKIWLTDANKRLPEPPSRPN